MNQSAGRTLTRMTNSATIGVVRLRQAVDTPATTDLTITRTSVAVCWREGAGDIMDGRVARIFRRVSEWGRVGSTGAVSDGLQAEVAAALAKKRRRNM